MSVSPYGTTSQYKEEEEEEEEAELEEKEGEETTINKRKELELICKFYCICLHLKTPFLFIILLSLLQELPRHRDSFCQSQKRKIKTQVKLQFRYSQPWLCMC